MLIDPFLCWFRNRLLIGWGVGAQYKLTFCDERKIGKCPRLLSRVGEVVRNSSIKNQLSAECHVSPNRPVWLLRHWLGAACGNLVFPGSPGNSASEVKLPVDGGLPGPFSWLPYALCILKVPHSQCLSWLLQLTRMANQDLQRKWILWTT